MKVKGLVTGLLGLTLSITSFVPVCAQESFSDFEEEMFKDVMEEDYLNLHYTLKDYESLGIEKPEVTVGSAEWDYDEAVEELEDYQERLHSFDYDSLTDEEKTDYDTIDFYLECQIQLNSYPYFDFKFDSAEGIINNLLTNFTEFVFYEKEDIDDYLTVLSTVPDYLDGCIEITQKQAAAGYFLTNDQLTQTIEDIDKFVEKTDDNQLIVIFDNNVDSFEGLTDKEKQEYKEKNKDIVLNEYIPAYEKVKEELLKLKGSRKGNYNLCSLEDGEDYYAALAKSKTGLDLTVEEMFNLCTEFLTTTVDEIVELQSYHSEEIEEKINIEDDAQTILEYLNAHMSTLPEYDSVNYKVSYLDASVANDSTVAYYLQPTIDDTQDNTIKVNGDNIQDVLDLYQTLAHEGFPGHCYQVNYYLQSNPAKIRTQVGNLGYTEGWAMYAEKLALNESSLNEYAAQYQALYTELNYCLDAAVDLGVNGLGWGTSQISEFLKALGLSDIDSSALYDFVAKMPGTILPYGVGIAKFELLEDKAREELGDKFDQKEFNKVLLDGGDRPFSLVEQDVDEYIGLDAVTETATPSADSEEVVNLNSTNYILYGVVGGCIVLIGIIALIGVHKHRKDNPFNS